MTIYVRSVLNDEATRKFLYDLVDGVSVIVLWSVDMRFEMFGYLMPLQLTLVMQTLNMPDKTKPWCDMLQPFSLSAPHS
jgi:hypothetical protein